MSETELIAKKVYLQQTMMLQSLALPYFCFAFCWDTGYWMYIDFFTKLCSVYIVNRA